MTDPNDPIDAAEAAGLTVTPVDEPVLEPHWMNVPNAFTFLRVLLVPVILWLLTVEGTPARWWAFGVFVFAALTDALDGWVARKFHGVTRWGQLADPLADKLLVLGALASLALVDEVPWWAVLVILAREVAVTALRVRLVTRLRLVLPASVAGKIKTITQIVAVAAYLAPTVSVGVADVLLYLAVAATIASGLQYAFSINKVRSESSSADPASGA